MSAETPRVPQSSPAADEVVYRPAALAFRDRVTEENAAEESDAELSPARRPAPRREPPRWLAPWSLPVVRQTTDWDCGAACLAMALAARGRRISLEEVRRSLGDTPAGADAVALLKAAAVYGLRGRGLQIHDLALLRSLPRGAILHWRFHHYVVLDRMDRKGGAWLLDPAAGRRQVDPAELDRSFTGVALVFENDGRRKGLRGWLRALLR